MTCLTRTSHSRTNPIGSTVDTLRPFDPAPATLFDDMMPDGVVSIRAEARLEQILATAPGSVPPLVGTPRRAPSRRAVALRWAAVPAVAAAVLVVSIAWPDRAHVARAFDTWTAVPSPVTASALADADTFCRTSATDSSPAIMLENPANQTPGNPTDSAHLSLTGSEQRGEFVLLVYRGVNGQSVTCLTRIPVGATRPTLEYRRSDPGASAEGDSTSLSAPSPPSAAGGKEFVSPAPAPADLAPDDVAATFGSQPTAPDDGVFTILAGQVGTDITGLTVHTADGKDVAATIADGQFVAWWPGGTGLFDAATTPSTDDDQPPMWVLPSTITHTDGTTANVLLTQW